MAKPSELVRCINMKTGQVINMPRWICDSTQPGQLGVDATLWQSATGFMPQEIKIIEPIIQAPEYVSMPEVFFTIEDVSGKKNIPQKKKKTKKD